MKTKKLLSFCVTVIFLFSAFFVPTEPKVEAAVGVKSNGNGGTTDVGAWFVTYNNESMWANNFGSGFPIKYRPLMPDGSYGIPDSSDKEVVDFQLKELSEAKVDFILFDLTNGGLTQKINYGIPDKDNIIGNAQFTCERIKAWNESHEWKIKYAIAVGTYAAMREAGVEGTLSIGQTVEYQAEGILKLFYHKFGEDNYYQIKGKPLLVIHDFGTQNDVTAPGGWKMYKASSKTDHDSGAQFLVRGSLSNPNEETGFSWLTPREGGNIVTEESATVCPGQWNHFSPSPAAPRENGDHYIRDWQNVLNYFIAPNIVLISSWNDFNEDTAVFTSDSSSCDESWEEQWKDDTGNINNTMYLQITKEAIWRLRTKNGDKFDNLDDLLKDNDRIWLTHKDTDEKIAKLVKTAAKYKKAKITTKTKFDSAINPYYLAAALGAFSFIVLVSAGVILYLNLHKKKKRIK